VVLTPTYSGCPATEVIAQSVRDALGAGLGPVTTAARARPAWTTDWISDDGRRKLRDYGIAPPGRGGAGGAQPMRVTPATSPARAAAARRPSAVGLRLHRLQGAVPLPGLPRALRTLQADMTSS
jgi:ring-1,2-phenylacetyl-CoA epoxidase subunit PaaD